ncbi:hypothetical protein [Streptomyces sp. NPDC088719]
MILNELAQGIRPMTAGFPEDGQRKVLHALVLFCGQAEAVPD